MWLSKRINESVTKQQPEEGKITLSGSGVMEADATLRSRNVRLCLPYGYAAGVPSGTEVVLLPAADCLLAFGNDTDSCQLPPGEICIRSKGGASIALKNDGTVVINGRFTINKEGNVI